MKKNNSIYEKILIYLFILEEVSNDNRKPKLGRGFFTARRLNPYNPLSYLFIFLIILIGLLMYGFFGAFKEIDITKNPFKWD